MATEWNMPRHGHTCTTCGRTFEPGDAFQAYIYAAGEGFERRDVCLTCTPSGADAPLGFWKTRRPIPTQRKHFAFDREAIFTFFTRLDEGGPPGRVQFRFVLALLLWRKKALKFLDSHDADGRELWRFTTPHGEQQFEIERPALDEQQVESLSVQLEQLLAGGSSDLGAVVGDLGAEPNELGAGTNA